jgi:hypothetical protein
VNFQAREQRAVLLRLLEESLARGHRRMVIRRYLMLKVRGLEVPHALEVTCEELITSRTARDIRRIDAAVREWAWMLEWPAIAEAQRH